MSRFKSVECVSSTKKVLVLDDKEVNLLIFGEDKLAVSNLLSDFFCQMLESIQDESSFRKLMTEN